MIKGIYCIETVKRSVNNEEIQIYPDSSVIGDSCNSFSSE